MDYAWANPEQTGVITVRDGILFYLDAGPEFDAAVAGGPEPFPGPITDQEYAAIIPPGEIEF